MALAALGRWFRNGSPRPATVASTTEALPSPIPPVLPSAGGGEDLECVEPGCHGPGTCVWEADAELIRVCIAHCTYCNPAGDLDRVARRHQLQVTGGSLR